MRACVRACVCVCIPLFAFLASDKDWAFKKTDDICSFVSRPFYAMNHSRLNERKKSLYTFFTCQNVEIQRRHIQGHAAISRSYQ